ncbi:MAG: NAD(P)-dependent oxidoreductase [Deltaproteobacteria bacterium]|nr:MAG: NAD(P)-dependent oxidoreductase [Deltaproteobacteria bacterium]
MRTGFVGLGYIGKPMAQRLPAAGLETTVFDIAPAPVQELAGAGAKAAASPDEVAAASDVVGVCVQTDAQVRAVIAGDNGLLAGAEPGLVIAIHSTILPSSALAMNALAAKQGVLVMDACVSGNTRAADPMFKLYVGGEAEQVERIRPYLTAIAADRVIHAGPLGSGCKAKICLNLVTYLQWMAAFEGSALASATGLGIEMFERVGRSNGQLTDMMVAYLGTQKLPEPARKSEAYQAYVRTQMLNAEKDLACALDLAREAGVSLPGAALVSQLMARIYVVDDPKRR